MEGTRTYRTLDVLGPEHEFSLVDDNLQAHPIADKVIKDFYGRVVNIVKLPHFTFGKELQLHVLEIKPNAPFRFPQNFEENMHEAVLTLLDFLERKFELSLLGTGMHPLLNLEDTDIWPHRHRKIYQAYSQVFNLHQHGWLNIQSFHINLPYATEDSALFIHNALAELCAYLPALSASSPIYEGRVGEHVDNRLHFYRINQKEIPSITGDVIPEYISSFKQYKTEIIQKYTADLAKAGLTDPLLNQDWVNSRGAILRFDRKAIEIRTVDEQECIKSDVAISCFVRAVLKGFMKEKPTLLPHNTLVKDFNSIITHGLHARVHHPHGQTARHVCRKLYNIAWENATKEEKKYLPIVRDRIEYGNLSELISKRVQKKAQKTDYNEAILSVYADLNNSLIKNQPYS